MTTSNLSEKEQRFLKALYQKTDGDLSVKVETQDIGKEMGMDRTAAAKLAEAIIGFGLAEVKTLSGGIAITEPGVAAVIRLGCGKVNGAVAGFAKLGDSPLPDDTVSKRIEKVVAILKSQLGEQSWDFDSLSELMADLKTIDAQMVSPRPKTAVLRECFVSIRDVLKKTGSNGEELAQVEQLLS